MLTPSYIDEHLIGIHNWDSWGRAIFEQALNEARKKVGKKSSDAIELNAVIRVSPVARSGNRQKPFCIKVEVDLGNGPISAQWHNKASRDGAK